MRKMSKNIDRSIYGKYANYRRECEAMGGVWVNAHYRDRGRIIVEGYCRTRTSHEMLHNNFEGAKIMKNGVAEYRISREPDDEGFYRFSVTSHGKTESGIAHSYEEAKDRAAEVARKKVSRKD